MAYTVAANATERPEHVALVDGARRISYRDFFELVCRTAHVLRERGIGQGGRVALLLPNSIEFFAVSHAAALLGALAVPINFRWRRGEIAYLLADSRAGSLVVDAAFLPEALPALAEAGTLEPSRCLMVGDGDALPSFAAAVAGAPALPPAPGTRETGFNVLIYTSGTTGRPKGVLHPSFDPKIGFEAQKRLVEMWGFTTDDVHLVVGPTYHLFPNAYAVQHLFIGATVVLMRKFDA